MKKFYLKLVAIWCVGIAALTGACVVSSCATLSEHSAVIQLVVGQATMRYIESAPVDARAARAGKVMAVADELSTFLDHGEVTISQLAAAALARIPTTMLPADKQLAVAVIQIAAQELSRKVGEGVLTPETTVRVNYVLQAVRDAASIYAGA